MDSELSTSAFGELANGEQVTATTQPTKSAAVRLGRPPKVSVEQQKQAALWFIQGTSVPQIAVRLDIGHTTAFRYIKRWKHLYKSPAGE